MTKEVRFIALGKERTKIKIKLEIEQNLVNNL